METYLPYGDIQEVLEIKAMAELELMDNAIETFTEVVVDMIAVQQVAEIASEAETPQEEAEVQEFVTANVEVLTIDQEEVDTYNQAVDDIETHANNASAFLAVAGNEQAVEFLEQGIENANTTAEQTNIFYDANAQWVAMGYNTTRNLTAVYLNGDNFGLDLYATEADILAAGSESEFFQTSPVALGIFATLGAGISDSWSTTGFCLLSDISNRIACNPHFDDGGHSRDCRMRNGGHPKHCYFGSHSEATR